MPRRSPTASQQVRAAHLALADPDGVARGTRLGRRPLGPLADRRRPRDRSRPGRRCALWAHDHHALLVSRAGLEAAGVTRDTPDPSGGVIRRTPDGEPEGRPARVGHPARRVGHPAHGAGGPGGGADRRLARAAQPRDRRGPRPGRTGTRPRPRLVVSGLCAPVRDRPPAAPRDGVAARRRAGHRARRRPPQRRSPRRTIRTVAPASAG